MPDRTPSSSPRRLLYAGRFLEAWQQGHWQWAARPQGRWGVTILAYTAEGQILLVQQYRYPMGAQVVELPAGMVEHDEPGEPSAAQLLARAQMELVEETGYRAGRMELLCIGPVAPGLVEEQQALVRAGDLEKVGPGGGVDKEKIRVHAVAVDRLDRWADAQRRRGVLVDLKVYLAELFAPW